MNTKKKITTAQVKAADKYPGAAINIADDEEVTRIMVKDRVAMQNNNPRNYK